MSDYESKVIRRRIKVYGAVQGVGFRYRTQYAANSLGVTGWVRNNLDGTVSLEMQGTEEQIDRVFIMVRQRSYIYIEKIDTATIPLEEQEYGFIVKGDM